MNSILIMDWWFEGQPRAAAAIRTAFGIDPLRLHSLHSTLVHSETFFLALLHWVVALSTQHCAQNIVSRLCLVSRRKYQIVKLRFDYDVSLKLLEVERSVDQLVQ